MALNSKAIGARNTRLSGRAEPLKSKRSSDLARLGRIDVLVIDDWGMALLSEAERRDFWEICEDRYPVRSKILTSELPVSRWHEQIGDPTLADGHPRQAGP